MNGHRWARWLGLLVVAVLVLPAGCAPPPKKRQFNNLLSGLNEDLAVAAKEFYGTLEPVSKGGNPQQGAPRAAYDKCKVALRKVQEVFDGTWPPRNSIKGVSFRLAYSDYLKAQHKILDDYFAEIVAICESKQAPGAKWTKISPLVEQAGKIDKEAYDALISAQGEFAQAHNYTPK